MPTVPANHRSPSSESGFSLIELLLAVALMAVGVGATIGVFGASSRTTVIAQQGQVGAQQAQAELDRLSRLKYGQLALTSTPANSTDTLNPNNRVSGGNLTIRSGLSEALVTTAGEGETAQVDPGPRTSRSAAADRRSPARSTATSPGATRTVPRRSATGRRTRSA